jgi:tyrosine-protein kinase Etk/Wzc
MEPNLTPGNFSLPDDENLDIKRYLSLFMSNWYWFAIALLISLSFAYAVNRYSVKIFTVSSSLLIKDDQIAGSNNTMGTIIPGGDIFRSQQNLKNEMGILKSFMLNYKVMDSLIDFHVDYIGVGRRRIVERQMYKTCPFKVINYSTGNNFINIHVNIELLTDTTFNLKFNNWTDTKIRHIGERITERGFDFVIEPRIPGGKLSGHNSSNNYIFYFTDLNSLANDYRSKLYVGPIDKDASLVNLSVSGFVPEQEADYLNMLMQVYLNYGQEYKSETAKKTMDFIDKQIKIISEELKKTEDNMATFRKDSSYFEPGKEGSGIQGRLEAMGNEKATFELQLQYYNYLFEYLQLNNTREAIISPSVIGITDPVIIRLVNDLSVIQKEKSKLELNIEANQPAIALIDRQAEESREELRENVKDGIKVLKVSISNLNRKIASVEEELKKLPIKDIAYLKVQREFDIKNQVYTYLLEKRAETGIAKASIVADNRMIDEASPLWAPQIKPKTRKNYLIAIILGLMVPMSGIVLIDYLNDKVIDKMDVQKKTKVPVIGFISHSDVKGKISVIERPSSSLAESFRSIRTSLKYFIRENDKPVISISSTISSEGKTFISINLAAIIAMLDKKVLIIGLDLRKPRLNKIFEFDESPGLSNFLSGNCLYEDVIKKTQVNNLFYAPSGPVPPNPSELIETNLMKEFMELAKIDYDFIIIDTPPVAIVTDALLLSEYVDINLFIVRQRYSSRNTLDIIEQLYRNGKLKNMAIIINDINLSGYYGYGMRYKYSLGYGYSYGYNYYGKGYYKRYGYSDKSHGYYKDES